MEDEVRRRPNTRRRERRLYCFFVAFFFILFGLRTAGGLPPLCSTRLFIQDGKALQSEAIVPEDREKLSVPEAGRLPWRNLTFK